MKTYLTYQELSEMNACKEALSSFKTIFGKKATIKRVVYRLQNPGEKDKYAEDYERWLGWLIGQTQKLTIALLKAGADIHTCRDYALRWAVESSHTEMVKILLEAGADIHTGNDYALRLAEAYGYTEMVELLKSKGAKS